MNKRILILGFVVLLLLSAFFTFNNHIYTQKQIPTEVTPYQATLTGEYVCLPHTNQEGPQTMECAFGLKTASGEYYALDLSKVPELDFNRVPQARKGFTLGESLTVSGEITPVEMLSSSNWQRYPIVGILTVSAPTVRE